MRRFLEKLAGVTVHLDRPPVDPKERRYTERVIRLSVQNLAKMPNAAALNARFQAGGVVRGPGWSARLEKEAEFAPGIPDNKRIGRIEGSSGPHQYVEQLHDAHRAGRHVDVRIAQGDVARSWAVNRMPSPGEQVLAKQQPDHTRAYMSFHGKIEKGYGSGQVAIQRAGQADVVEMNPHHIAYNVYEGKRAHEYALTQVGRDPRDWLLRNRSTVHGKYPIPTDKPKYREEPYSADLTAKPGTLLPKVDGGHSITMLETGKRPRVFSYREGKRGDVLEYTHKIPGMFAQKVPPGLVRGRVLVRGETFLQEGGRALGPNRTAALLNSSIDKARRAQEGGAQLRVMPFDIMGDKSPYPDRLKKLQEIARVLHGFVAPEAAHTPREKAKLIHAIQSGRHPLTSEGVVRFPPGHIGGEGAVKAKLVAEQDVLVHSVFPGKGRHEGRAGGFTYSREAGGKPVGRVGTGLSDREREWLWRHRDAVRGRVAKVTHDRQTRSGALYAPRVAKGAGFLGWHLDKNLGA